jgi:general stress protein 26
MSDVNKNDIKMLNDRIKGIQIAMMTTVDQDGSLKSRPMATQEMDNDGYLWFFTRASDAKVGDVQQDQQVNISYEKPGDNLFISVSGTAELVRDQKKINDLWKPLLKAWFPNGKDDPEIALLKVSVNNAEYWDSPSGIVGRLFAASKGLASGGKDSGGEDVKLNIR